MNRTIVRKGILSLAGCLLGLTALYGESWPTAAEQAQEMIIGWNIGNSLEVPGNETGWGNAKTTQRLIDSVHAAGFNAIRIPCAWDSYANSSMEIQESWLNRVQEVVDFCLNNDMFVIINSHWDGGWLEENPTYDKQEEVNIKQEAYWTQVANHFIDYDARLLFAGTNEVRANYGTPTAEHIEVQESYNQTFVNAVRATGGNNLNRNLIVQTYNTNIDHGLNFFSMPSDVVEEHLMVEVHYYDPYHFTLNQNSSNTTWGEPFQNLGSNDSWGNENHVDNTFLKVKEEWVDNGIPVILGEYGVIHRQSLTGKELEMHNAAREYWLEYVTKSAIDHGMIPFYWDNGHAGDNGFALFNRSTGATLDGGAIQSLINAAGVGELVPRYVLEVKTNGSGSVMIEPGSIIYNEGTEVTVTATPAQGWQFEGWSGDLETDSNPTTITMTSDISLTANFTSTTSSPLNSQNKSFKAYPNPTSDGRINIELNSFNSKTQIRIINSNGMIVSEHQIEDEQSFEINLNANPGIYLLQITNSNKLQTERIIVL